MGGDILKEARGSPKLTPKQEKFVLGLVEGKSQRESYKDAYDTEKMSDKTIDERASRLLSEYKVSTRFHELMQEVKEKALWTVEMAQKELIEMLLDSKEDRNYQGRYNAIKELNTLLGFYDRKKEEKVDKAATVLDKLEELL